MSTIKDIVLIHYQNKPAVYAIIEGIEPDIKRDWYQVTLLLLTIPPQRVIWILRDEYIRGTPFTMGGQPMKLQPIEEIMPEVKEQKPEKKPSAKKTPAKVIPFTRKEDNK